MTFTILCPLFFLFLAVVITALEPLLSARSIRLELLRATNAAPLADIVPAGVDG